MMNSKLENDTIFELKFLINFNVVRLSIHLSKTVALLTTSILFI